MNHSQITDLKNFISTTVAQSHHGLTTNFNNQIKSLRLEMQTEFKAVRSEIHVLRQEMHEGFAGVAEAIAGIHDTSDNHEIRISNLESVWSPKRLFRARRSRSDQSV